MPLVDRSIHIMMKALYRCQGSPIGRLTSYSRNNAIIHVNISNDAYKMWLETAYIETYNRYSSGERIVFIHSWNEWCEGTYIEPDGRYGRNLLEQTSAAIREGQDAIRLSRELDVSPGRLRSLVRIYREKEEAAFRVTKMLCDKANHSAHEANQNGSCFSCQVYWRGSDEDYTESRSQSSLLGIGVEQQRIGFALPEKAVQALRFDPSNRKGLLRLYAVRLLGAGMCLWEWDGKIETLATGKLNSILLSPLKVGGGGAVLCLLSDDPWLELPVPPEVLSQADYLEADISWPMPEDLLGVLEKWEDLMGQNKHFAMELQAVLHSRSWILTKPLRWAVRQLRRFRAKCR